MKFHDLFSTLTNIAFIVVGFLVFFADWYVGFCTVGLGFTSWMYHSQKTRFWRHADVISIYFVLIAIISYMSIDWEPLAFLFGCVFLVLHADIHPMDGRKDDNFLRARSWLTIGVMGATVLLLCIISLPTLQTLTVISFFAGWGLFNLIWINRKCLEWPYWIIDLSHSLTHIAAALGIYHIMQ